MPFIKDTKKSSTPYQDDNLLTEYPNGPIVRPDFRYLLNVKSQL